MLFLCCCYYHDLIALALLSVVVWSSYFVVILAILPLVYLHFDAICLVDQENKHPVTFLQELPTTKCIIFNC